MAGFFTGQFGAGSSSSGGGGGGTIGGTVGTTDNAVPRADGTGGSTLQGSGITIDDSNTLIIPGRIQLTGSGQFLYMGDTTFGDTLGIGITIVGFGGGGAWLRDNAGQLAFLGGGGAAVASAASIQPTGVFFHVTGTASISTISGTINSANMLPGNLITMIFDSTATVVNGATIKLAGGVNFVATADDTLTLRWDSTRWVEVGRSVN